MPDPRMHPIPCKIDRYVELAEDFDLAELELYETACNCDECKQLVAATSLGEMPSIDIEHELSRVRSGNRLCDGIWG